MASIRNRKGKFQTRVKRSGYPEQVKTFHRREDAVRWGRQVEFDLDHHNLKFPPNEVKALTLRKLVVKYMKKVLPFKRYPGNEVITLNAFLKNSFVDNRLAIITPETFANYRNKRLVNVKPATFLREIMIISHIYNTARREWGLDISNPIEAIKKPRPDQHRDRTFRPGEREVLLKNADPLLKDLIELSIETALRRSELLNIKKSHIEGFVLSIPQTKTGIPRKIPLTRKALYILNDYELPFPITAVALRHRWDRLCNKVNVIGLTWHDLRHISITNWAARNIPVTKLQMISGHRSLSALNRYVNLKPEDLAEEINSDDFDRSIKAVKK